jgi:hypothetical protein
MVCSIFHNFWKVRDENLALDEKFCTTNGTAMVANDRHELHIIQSDFYGTFDVIRLR